MSPGATIRFVAKDNDTKLGWRLLWAVVGAGLTFTVLSVAGLELPLPALIGISVAGGVLVGAVGPAMLDLLNLV